MPDRVALGSNLGWSYGGSSDDPYSAFRASLALGVSMWRRWTAFAEYYAFLQAEGRPDENYLNTGLVFLLARNVQLDVRLGAGLESPWPNYFAGIGAAFRI